MNIKLCCILLLSLMTIAWGPVCRHNALYVASVVGEHYPVKIALGEGGQKRYQSSHMRFHPPFSNPTMFNKITENHVQAKAEIDGKWQWLGIVNNKIVITSQDNFTPEVEYSLDEYYERFFKGQIKEKD